MRAVIDSKVRLLVRRRRRHSPSVRDDLSSRGRTPCDLRPARLRGIGRRI